MAGLTDAIEQALLDHIFTDPTYTPPTTLYIGLSSTTPTDAGGNITEPSGNGYARVATTSADWGAATGTAPATKSNTSTKTFPTATGDWSSQANQTHFVIMTASTAGSCIGWGALTTPKAVLNGDTPSFASGALVLKMGDPSDSY